MANKNIIFQDGSDNLYPEVADKSITTAKLADGAVTKEKLGTALASELATEASTTKAGLMSADDKSKLEGIASGAQVNAVTSVAGRTGAVTLTKEDVGLSNVDNTADSDKHVSYAFYSDTAVTARHADIADSAKVSEDVPDWAKTITKPSYNKAEVGLPNVDNVQQIPMSQRGAVNGVATLDGNGKIPTSQLPSYVSDVFEYAGTSKFPTTGEANKIYIDTTDGREYRWSGTQYSEISKSIALGETSETAYAGDKGKKVADDLAAHKAASNPHNITKSTVGLGNVADINQSKAVKSITRSGTTFTMTHLDGTTDTFDQEDYDTTYELATPNSAGLMSRHDKAKLDGIESRANNYVTV